jgi:hypothetical protein
LKSAKVTNKKERQPGACEEGMKYSTGKNPHRYFLDESISIQTAITGHHAKRILMELMPDGLLMLRCNFLWNGSSFVQDTPACMRASAFHDALCRMISQGLLPASVRPAADKLYYDLCREDGMSWLQAKVRYAGLRVYGIVSSIG